MGLDLSACAPKFGLAGNIAVLAFGMISLVAAFSGNAVWVVVAGILITPLECPMLWKCNDKCEKFTDILKNKLMMKNWYVRGTLYALLSILMFSGSVYCIIAGLVMDVMAISYIFAEFQGLRETSEDEAAYSAA